MSLLSLDHSSDLDYIHKVLASYPDASLPPWFLENTIRALQQNSNLTDLNTQQETQEAIDQTLPLRLAELHARAEKAAVALAAKRKAIPNLIKKAEIMREKRKREVDEIATLKIDERKKQELERHEKEDVTEKMKSLGDIWTQIQKITENTEKLLPAVLSKSERTNALIQDDILCEERYKEKRTELTAQKENMDANLRESAATRRIRGFLLKKIRNDSTL